MIMDIVLSMMVGVFLGFLIFTPTESFKRTDK